MAKEILLADNFSSINIVEKTVLNADAAASQAVITTQNVQGFAADDYVLVGNIGSERAELRKIASITGQNITFSVNLAQPHTKSEAVTKLRGNQIKFYRAANVDGSVPDDDDFDVIATVAIEPDQTATEYIDSVGGTGYWYKYIYYNDVSGQGTDLSEAQAARGGGYNRYATIAQVRSTAGLKTNNYITDADIEESLEEAESQVKASLATAGYNLPLGEVPPLVRYVTRLLAAGFVLGKDHGAQHRDTTKDGQAKVDQALKILQKIEDKKITLVVPPDDSIDSSDSVGIAGYPDSNAEDESPSEGSIFHITDVF